MIKIGFDEPIANKSFETLDALEDVLFERCQSLLQQQELIQGKDRQVFLGGLQLELNRN